MLNIYSPAYFLLSQTKTKKNMKSNKTTQQQQTAFAEKKNPQCGKKKNFVQYVAVEKAQKKGC